MRKGRLEAFSDGVIAIIITIMVLELRPPHDAGWEALRPLFATFSSYVLSFVFVGIYWNNHHHMLHAVEYVDGRILWANLALLFWMSLIPFATGWMGETSWAAVPTAVYGLVLLMAGLAYSLLEATIHRAAGAGVAIARGARRRAEGDDLGRGVRPGDRADPRDAVDLARDLRRYGAALARSRPADREATGRVSQGSKR
jgi:uncharacterized membrane protein